MKMLNNSSQVVPIVFYTFSLLLNAKHLYWGSRITTTTGRKLSSRLYLLMHHAFPIASQRTGQPGVEIGTKCYPWDFSPILNVIFTQLSPGDSYLFYDTGRKLGNNDIQNGWKVPWVTFSLYREATKIKCLNASSFSSQVQFNVDDLPCDH